MNQAMSEMYVPFIHCATASHVLDHVFSLFISSLYSTLFNLQNMLFTCIHRNLSKTTYFCLGMLSKSRGQVLRIATILHMLFSIEQGSLCPEVSDEAVGAAIDLVKTACQQTAFIAGKGLIPEAMQGYKAG